MASLVNKFSKESHTTSFTDQKVESKLNARDLEALEEGFSFPGKGYDGKISYTKEQFIEALGLILNRGTRAEYGELFDKIDITGEGRVDWEKFASHLMLEFYERDDRMKTLSVPHWRDLVMLNSPHKDVIQKVIFMKNISRYFTISKEGLISMWGIDLKPQRTTKVSTDSCRPRDLWVTDFVMMPNINKLAVAFTSKEIAFYSVDIKLTVKCQVKLTDIINTPLCMDYWHKPENNESYLAWGDIGGYLNVLFWTQPTICLFERPSNLVNEKEVRYIPSLEAFITCATVWNSSLVISWLEKLPTVVNVGRSVSKRSVFIVHQGINAFDYHEGHNQLATAGVNYHVCLWNPYVVSKPNGLLRGHIAPVVAVQFHRSRGRLFSFSRDHILRIWDVQMQICLQRIAGIFPKGIDVITQMLFHEDRLRLLLTFNNTMAMMEIKVKVHDRILSHDKPVIGVLYNAAFSQVVSVSQDGTISFWLAETGQRVKKLSRTHNEAELTCLVQDPNGIRFYTGSTDGSIKIWDMNGYCHHTLICFGGAHSEVGQIVILKRAVIAMGSSSHFTIFRTTNFRDHYVYPSEWKGAPQHDDDVLAGVALPPNGLITGSYDGELVVWNTNSELAARRMTQRCIKTTDNSTDFLFNISRLIIPSNRKHIGSGSQKGANLISCGGNGIVRFWNAYACILVGEFTAHEKVSSIIMAIDETGEVLSTGDAEGVVKVWNIKDYCMTEGKFEVTEPPLLLHQWKAHVDLVTGLAFCTRIERRLLLVTSSFDCSVHIWKLDGSKVGTFGQDLRWKLENLCHTTGVASTSSTETSPSRSQSEAQPDPSVVPEAQLEPYDSEISVPIEFALEQLNELTQDASVSEVCNALATFRINAWGTTILGKEYQEARMNKRHRKQPRSIHDLPYLYGEKFGRPNYGPYYSLALSSFEPVEELEQPDFMEHPEDYFADRGSVDGDEPGEQQLRTLSATEANRSQHNACDSTYEVKNRFDEASFFPAFVMGLDKEMKHVNRFVSRNMEDEKLKEPGKRLELAVNSRYPGSLPPLQINPKNVKEDSNKSRWMK